MTLKQWNHEQQWVVQRIPIKFATWTYTAFL